MYNRTGLIAVFGIWLTAGIALPLVNVLQEFSTTQLMVLRGGGTALFAVLLVRCSWPKLNRNTLALMLVLPLATLGLYQGIRLWGAGPTIIMIAATPIVNGLWALMHGRSVSLATLAGFTFVICGVYLAQDAAPFALEGFLWATFAMLMNAILYELFKRVDEEPAQKCLVTATGMTLLGALLSWDTDWNTVFTQVDWFVLGAFVLIGGVVYWFANLYTFKHLPVVEGSVLAQGEAPAVIIGAWLILGETPTLQQAMGVSLSLLGLYLVVRWLE